MLEYRRMLQGTGIRIAGRGLKLSADAMEFWVDLNMGFVGERVWSGR